LEQYEARQGGQCHLPVEEGYHYDDEQRVEQALQHHHYRPGCYVAQQFHGIGGNGGYFAQAVRVEVAHGQVAEVFGYLDAFAGAGAVAAFGLPHGYVLLGDDAARYACQHDENRLHYGGCVKGSSLCGGLYHALQHYRYGYNFQDDEKRVYNAQNYGVVEFLAVLFVAKQEKAS